MRKVICQITLSVPTGVDDKRELQKYNVTEVTAGADVSGNAISPCVVALHNGELKLLSIAVEVPRGAVVHHLVKYPAEILEVLKTNQTLLDNGIQVVWMGYRIQCVQYFSKCDVETFEPTKATRVIHMLGATFNVAKPGKLGGAVELARLEKVPGEQWKTYVAAGVPTEPTVEYLLGRFK